MDFIVCLPAAATLGPPSFLACPVSNRSLTTLRSTNENRYHPSDEKDKMLPASAAAAAVNRADQTELAHDNHNKRAFDRRPELKPAPYRGAELSVFPVSNRTAFAKVLWYTIYV